jgi:micrococcal nuclease
LGDTVAMTARLASAWVFCSAIWAPSWALAAPAETFWVHKVTDGDTLKVRRGTEKLNVRLLGIDCPEAHRNAKCERDGLAGRRDCDWQVPRGVAAGQRAATLAKDQAVTLECGGRCEQDRWGRWLRYVRLPDGTDLGLLLVREGLCEDFGWKYPHPRGEPYRSAEAEAKAARRGIWAP